MTLVKFNNKHRAFDPWVDNLFHTVFNESPVLRHTTPSVNIFELDNRFTVEMAAPGFKKDDFKINLDKKILTISVEEKEKTKNETESNEEKRYTKREFAYYTFTRSFTLPEEADENKISAEYVDGILKVDIYKKEEVKNQTKMIEVK